MSFDVWTVLSPETLITIRNHVLSMPHTEVGGFLLGSHGEEHQPPTGVVAVEAWQAEGDLTRLTFTHAAWEHVHRIQDEHYPDTAIIGWYHSHPGHGIFLSEHDQFIQRHFFGAPWQIAVVVDPIARTEGMFAWARGEIVLISERPIGTVDDAAAWSGATAFTPRDGPRESTPKRLVVELDDEPIVASAPVSPAPRALVEDPVVSDFPAPPRPVSPRPRAAVPTVLWLAAAATVILAIALLALR